MSLKTDYKDAMFQGNRKYQMIQNEDGTVSFEDVTEYTQEGDSFGAKDINDTNTEVEKKFDSSDVVDPMVTTQAGFAADAKATGDALKSQNSKIDSIWSKIYPVGSIYMSANSTNPGTLFGGSWTQITGRFLLAAGGGYSAGATGGEATHKLTLAEIASHSHSYVDSYPTEAQGGGAYGYAGNNTLIVTESTRSRTTNAAGSSAAHNNMPPYLVVYVWRRTT